MLVSCICPTKDRRHFIPYMLRCFDAQDWPEKELVVVSDGWDSGGELLPTRESRLQHIRLSRPLTVGSKRNLACEAAAGKIICHFDDDDWSAPGRISDQVTRLLDSKGKAVDGYHTMLAWDTASKQLYRYHGGPACAIGTSLCYYRDWWTRNRFPAKQICEDAEFVLTAHVRGALITADAGKLMVFRIHDGNTSKKNMTGSEYQRVVVEELPEGFPHAS